MGGSPGDSCPVIKGAISIDELDFYKEQFKKEFPIYLGKVLSDDKFVNSINSIAFGDTGNGHAVNLKYADALLKYNLKFNENEISANWKNYGSCYGPHKETKTKEHKALFIEFTKLGQLIDYMSIQDHDNNERHMFMKDLKLWHKISDELYKYFDKL
jgi:uncharacterized protein YjiK